MRATGWATVPSQARFTGTDVRGGSGLESAGKRGGVMDLVVLCARADLMIRSTKFCRYCRVYPDLLMTIGWLQHAMAEQLVHLCTSHGIVREQKRTGSVKPL